MQQQITVSDLTHYHQKQEEFRSLVFGDKKFLLYGGSAGGGKSYTLRWLAIERLLEFASRGLTGVRVGLFCEDYPALKDRQISKIPYEFPPWLGTLNKGEHDFVLAPEYGGGVISFRNLDDVAKYLSAEFADIYVDELTRNQRETFDFLTTRLRWAGIEDSKFIAGTNPGQVGHGWVKKLWIDRDFADEKLNPDDFAMVQALPTDNPYLPKSYITNTLENLPDNLKRAYKEGDWDIFAGQFFTEFRRKVHVIEPFTDEKTLAWFKALPTYCGLDYGYHAQSAVIWAKFYDETWYIYRELYQTELTFEQLRDKITEIEEPTLIFADPSIWAKKDSPTSGADTMKPLILKPASNDRVLGWVALKQLFKKNKIKIFSTCPNLIRTIPLQVYNERAESKEEDLDTLGEDHLVDSLRYLIFSHKNIKPQQKPFTYTKIPSKINNSGDLDEVFARKPTNLTRPSYK